MRWDVAEFEERNAGKKIGTGFGPFVKIILILSSLAIHWSQMISKIFLIVGNRASLLVCLIGKSVLKDIEA